MVFTRSDIIAFFSFLLSGISVAVSLVASVRVGRAEKVNSTTVFHSLLYVDPVSKQLLPNSKMAVKHIIVAGGREALMAVGPYTYLAVKARNLDSTRALAGMKASIFVKNVERGWRIWKKPWFLYHSADLPDMQPLQTVDKAATTFNEQLREIEVERFLARVMPNTYAVAVLPAAVSRGLVPHLAGHFPAVKLRFVVTRTTSGKQVKMDAHYYWLKPQFEDFVIADRNPQNTPDIPLPVSSRRFGSRLLCWTLESVTAREKSSFPFWPF